MMKLKLLFAAILLVPAVSYAQYTGPNSKRTNFTLAELTANAKAFSKNKTLITLQGYITEQLSEKNTYVFKDETGKMNAFIPHDNLPSRPFDDKDKVLIIATLQAKKTNTLLVSKTVLMAQPAAPTQPVKANVAPKKPVMKTGAKPEVKEMKSEYIKGKQKQLKNTKEETSTKQEEK
jgi:uncharacterized protein (TIGR00156 family)